MTTLVGIKTNSGAIDAIVLGSDTQLNYVDDEGNLLAKKPLLKIIHGDSWALAPCGADTNDLRSFFRKLQNPDDKRYKDFDKSRLDNMINKALGKRRFIEVDELNARYSRDGGDLSEAYEFLMAFSSSKMDFFRVDAFGNLISPEDANYIVLGSGAELAKGYIEEQLERETYDSSDINLETAMKLNRGALKIASQKGDIFSGWPMDLVVVRKEKIISYGKRIRSAIEQAEEKEFDAIIKKEVEGI